MAALSYFGKKNPTTPANDVPGVFSWQPDPHRSLMDIDMPEALIGVKSAGRVYLDVSSLCEQPGFGSRADIDRSIALHPRARRIQTAHRVDAGAGQSLCGRRAKRLVAVRVAPLLDQPIPFIRQIHRVCRQTGS